jgi:two-component system nitrate/nitrite response regulator NarL
MRLLLCDAHRVFAESLAVVLTESGYHVVAITRTIDEALAALSREPVDVCVLDAGGSSPGVLDRLGELRAVAPGTGIVLLAESAAGLVPAAAAGVDGFAYRNQHVADVIDTIERVHGGETVGPAVARRDPPAALDDAHRLAALLTRREREVLCLLVQGEDSNGVARTMGVSWATARSHIQSALTKLGVHSRVEAAAVAVRYGLIDAVTGQWSLPARQARRH